MDVPNVVLVLALIYYEIGAEFEIGPYRMVITNLSTCPGPIGTGGLDMYLKKQPSGLTHVTIAGNIKNNIGPIGMEINWSVLGKRVYVTIFSLQTKKVCDILDTKEGRATSLFPKVDSRCFLQKGPYRQEISDVNAANHALFGNTAPYGKFKLKINVTAGRKFIMCKYFYCETVPI